MTTKHTPGPWRFEFDAKHSILHLVGGIPRYDLTVMDFSRWGMVGATILLRDTTHDGMNIMHKLHERQDWIAPEPGREHHKAWYQRLTHPDAVLIEAAPDLLDALQSLLDAAIYGYGMPIDHAIAEKASAAIVKATGVDDGK